LLALHGRRIVIASTGILFISRSGGPPSAWDALMRQDGPVRPAADSRAAQHPARDRRRFYKYLMQRPVGRAGGPTLYGMPRGNLLAELGFLIRTGI